MFKDNVREMVDGKRGLEQGSEGADEAEGAGPAAPTRRFEIMAPAAGRSDLDSEY
jgi:hypothetical protein